MANVWEKAKRYYLLRKLSYVRNNDSIQEFGKVSSGYNTGKLSKRDLTFSNEMSHLINLP